MIIRSAHVALGCLIAVACPVHAAPKCDSSVQAAITSAAAGASVSIASGNIVPAAQNFSVNWQRGQVSGRHPIYLMIAFDAPVRFDGKSFYALLPQASAAFGIQHFAGKTRAVIPLYGLGVPQRGEFKVSPLQAGPLNMQWAVIGHDRCKEYVAESGRGAVQISVISTGAPEIVISDVLAGDHPKQRIFSPAGGRTIEVFEGRYRIVEADSRAEIAERSGRTPRFSPTGRFVAAYVEDGVEILDVIDGKTIYKKSPGHELAWDNADSFAILAQGAWGSVAILMPSRADPDLMPNPPGGYACHACDAIQSVALRIDLENNVAVVTSNQGGGVTSLTAPAQNIPDRWAPNFQMTGARQEILAFIKRQSQVTDFSLPKRWELRGGLKFSHLGLYESGTAISDDRSTAALRKFLVRPLTSPIIANKPANVDAVQVTTWRGLSASEATASRNMLKRLREFGLPIPEDEADHHKSVAREVLLLNEIDDNGQPLPAIKARMSAAVRRIEKEISAARGVFAVRGKDGGSCAPFPEQPDQKVTKVYDEFQRAFRFGSGDRIVWLTQLQCQDGSAAFHYPSVTLFDSAKRSAWFFDGDADMGDPTTNVGTVCASNIGFCDFDAHLVHGRLLVLSSAASRAIEIYDLDQRRGVFKKYNLPRGDLLTQAIPSADGKWVFQINSDRSFAAFRFADTKLLFEGRYIDDEVIIWTPDGHFDATAEGAHFVSLRLPGKAANHTFEQFSAQLKTPGLMAKLLAGQTFDAPRLGSPPSLKGTMQPTEGRIRGKVEATADSALATLLVFQDGLLTDRLGAPLDGKSWVVDVGLLPGTRWASMVAVDKSGLASLPMGRAFAASPSSLRRVHVLAIGVDDYTDPNIPDLGLARSDARRFASAVSGIGKDITIATTKILYEKEASPEGVLTALRQMIDGAAPGETVLLFFAGHGIRSEDGNYFLATPDTRIADIKASALPWNDVAAVLATSRARIAVFLDTCHSGAAGSFSTNDAAAQSLLERIPSGIVVFSASKGRELSEEATAVGGGVFTSALVNVIAGERDRFDTNRNGLIEMSELYRGVKAQVTANTDGRQTPWIARNQMVGDFSLF